MVGLLKLEKYVLPFFSKIVVTKLILVGAPRTYSVILPVFVSILTPPALLGLRARLALLGRYKAICLTTGYCINTSVRLLLVVGNPTSSSPFQLSLRLSAQPKRLSMTNSFFCSAILYLQILKRLSSAKMIELVYFSNTIPLAKAILSSNTLAQPVFRSQEITLPAWCPISSSFTKKDIRIGEVSVRYRICLSSSIQIAFKAFIQLPSTLFSRQLASLLAISTLINPLSSEARQRVESSLVMINPKMRPVALPLKISSVSLLDGVTETTDPSRSPVQMMPCELTAMSYGQRR